MDKGDSSFILEEDRRHKHFTTSELQELFSLVRNFIIIGLCRVTNINKSVLDIIAQNNPAGHPKMLCGSSMVEWHTDWLNFADRRWSKCLSHNSWVTYFALFLCIDYCKKNIAPLAILLFIGSVLGWCWWYSKHLQLDLLRIIKFHIFRTAGGWLRGAENSWGDEGARLSSRVLAGRLYLIFCDYCTEWWNSVTCCCWKGCCRNSWALVGCWWKPMCNQQGKQKLFRFI